MVDKHADKARAGPDDSPRGPDMLLHVWAAWLQRLATAMPATAASGNPWSAMAPPGSASGTADDGGAEQMRAALATDPTLRAIDQMWNANPLARVVPIDWAEIARALRIVWLRSLAKPEAARSLMDLQHGLWRLTLDAWQEAGQRWLGVLEPAHPDGTAAAPADKRFAAPEWQSNPGYRLLKDAYLLASDWLLRQGDADNMDEAERRRVNFHLRQFVDATSPTLMLLSNPVALRRAIETGGGSVAAGARNLLADLSAGRLPWSMRTPMLPAAILR